MATVYSLVCWGGRTGKTVSISASTDVVTLTKHGVRTGIKLWPSGTLPAELNSSTPVYGRATGIDTFTLHTSSAGAIANTGQITFSGSSTYAAVVLKSDLVASPETALPAYGLSNLSRWGEPGSERIYDGIASWNLVRQAGANANDIEICEIGEAFTEVITAELTISVPSSGSTIVSKINGIRTQAFNYGRVPESSLVNLSLSKGYVFYTSSAVNAMLALSRYRDCVDGITLMHVNTGSLTYGIDLKAGQNKCTMCVLYSTTNIGSAINMRAAITDATNNTIVGWYRGFSLNSLVAGFRLLNNLVTKCTTSLPTDTQIKGFYYNNIIVGNTTANWSTQPAVEYASNNYGPYGTAWMSTGAVRYTIETTDFADWANNDFRPASETSPQVDTGLYPYDGLPFDIAGNVRPSYKGGAATEIDGGPYEYDHGYGPWPASATISLTSIVSGSRVLITKASDGTVLYNDVPGTSLSFNTTHIGDFNVVVRKATASPFYREFNASGTTVADQTTSIKCLQQLDE